MVGKTGASRRVGTPTKDALRRALELRFGVVESEVTFDWLRVPSRQHIGEPPLGRIHKALEAHRGFSMFGTPGRKLACDFYIPSKRAIIEVDEAQHFTAPRALSLLEYGSRVQVAFDVPAWVAAANKMNRHDNSPPYRDEQRAFYDALRDVLAPRNGFAPVVRFMEWELASQEAVEAAMMEVAL